MKCNLLHINIKKCCYMHFKPNNHKNAAKDYNELTLVLGHIPIKVLNQSVKQNSWELLLMMNYLGCHILNISIPN